MDLNERRQIIERGRQARDLLENETLSYCFDEIMGGLFGDFLATGSGDRDRREKLWDVGQGMKLIKDRLNAYADAAKIEEANKAYDEHPDDFNRTA